MSDSETELFPAKINDRFIAYIIDVVPFALCYWLAPRLPFFWVGAYLLYQFIGNATGATVGKRLMSIRVVGRDGRPLGLGRSLLRALGYGLSTPLFNFGFILALFHPESLALHDILAGSLVVESSAKNPAESNILFLAAVSTLIAMVGGTIYLHRNKPTDSDYAAVEKARQALHVLAQIEEAHKKAAGSYTKSLSELASASGDVETFKRAMGGLFDPNLFRLEAGNKGYRISGVARDQRKTRLTIEGPPPKLLP
ncbi:MAG: hypothetical protein A3J74_03550 [Elusimicrobia bacterium RIFCSPHIGHO2_02_FULL_57_9]|nr:MAG: hypothetical protein A3J74_03550 [Elusimicrobia bacterium RIFCSPHIGHO2_02_FULL_57_9]